MAEQFEAAVGGRVGIAPRPRFGLRRGIPLPPRAAVLVGWLEREAFLVVLLALYLVGLTWNLPTQIASDTWMTFAYGREIVHHGLPSHDVMTVWAQGRTWVDQQWLGQLIMYGAFALGGIRAAVTLHVLAVGGAMALALVAARRLGGSTRSVTWLALASFLVVAWSSWTLRVQSLVFPLFVLLLWLLASDSRSHSRRVFFALPLLVLWANLHGTAFLGAALIALRGASMLLEREQPLKARIPRAAVLLASPALLLASPYGLQLVDYYHRLLLNPAFRQYVTEWAPTRLAVATVPFYLLALLAAWLVGRCRGRLTLFEQAALSVTLVLALLAVRSVVWFMLSALVLLPVALDGVLSSRWENPRYKQLNRLMALPAPLLCAWVAIGSLSHPAAWYTRDFPPAAGNTVARIAAQSPGVRVFANERFADWLVIEHPELRGRIAFDGRFELLTARQLKSIVSFRARLQGGASVTRPYGILVLDPVTEKPAARSLVAAGARRYVYRDSDVIVLARSAR
jgi:hypothetical protein